jgi:hypothetical protein
MMPPLKQGGNIVTTKNPTARPGLCSQNDNADKASLQDCQMVLLVFDMKVACGHRIGRQFDAATISTAKQTWLIPAKRIFQVRLVVTKPICW